MPTEAFFKLEEKKRDQLINAAIHEFSTLPYEKVSIFKIAQNSDVSRSGFYYYFKDKADIYHYLIDQIKIQFIQKYDIFEKEYDFFRFCENVFEFIADAKGTSNEALFRRIIANMNSDDLKNLFTYISETEPADNCGVKCTIDQLRFETPAQMTGIIMLMSTSIIYSLAGYLDDEESREDAEKKLQDMFSYLKYGIQKREFK